MLSIVVVALPRTVLAAEPEHPWSIGAGVGFTYYLASLNASPGGIAPSPAVPVFSLERVIAPSTAIILGLAAQAATRDYPRGGVPLGWTATIATSWFSGGASVGVLRQLNDPDAPVRLSVIGSLFGAYGRTAFDQMLSDGTSTPGIARSWMAGVRGGLALDKPLLDGLSVRLAANLFYADYSWSKTSTDLGNPAAGSPGDSSGFDAHLAIDPTLELRFEF